MRTVGIACAVIVIIWAAWVTEEIERIRHIESINCSYAHALYDQTKQTAGRDAPFVARNCPAAITLVAPPAGKM